MQGTPIDAALFRIVTDAQSSFASERDLVGLSRELLRSLLEVTGSGYGLLASVVTLRPHPVMTPVAALRVQGSGSSLTVPPEPFAPPEDGPLALALRSRGAVVISDRSQAPPPGTLPAGHPPIANAIALPFPLGLKPRGLLFLANRRGGWDPSLAAALRPTLDTCANLFGASETEARLREREDQTRAILDAVPDGIVTLDERCRVLSTNPAADAMFDGPSLQGRPLQSVLDEPSAALLWATLEQGALGEGDPQRSPSLELTGLRAGTRPFPLRVRLRLTDGGAMVAVLQDLAGQRRLEGERNRFFRLAPQILVTLDLDGIVRDVNPAFRRILGWPESTVLGAPLLSFAHPADEPNGAAQLHADAEHATAGTWRARFRTASGSWRWLDWSGVVDAGEAARYWAAQDVTERAEGEQIKAQFVSVVSHELRTPLTSLRGSLGLLDGGAIGGLLPEQASLVRLAVTNTDRLIRLVNDILDLERAQQKDSPIHRRTCLADVLMEEAIAAVQGFSAERQVELHHGLPSDAAVLADPDRIVQVLVNLLGNAIKFSPPGATVHLWTEQLPSGAVRFVVRDEGPGIAQDQLPFLFEPFRQGDSSDTRAAGGTGLGLAIARRFIEQHGGCIDVESDLGRGSTFFFDLPGDRT